MKKLVFIYALTLINQVLMAQTSEVITSDRPGQAMSNSVVGTKVFQIQSGVTFSKQDSNEDFMEDNTLRYGLSESFEVNTAFSYRINNELGSGFDNLMLGARYNIISEADGLIPTLAIQSGIRFKEILRKKIFVL